MLQTAVSPLIIDCFNDADTFERLKSVWQTLERMDTQCSPFNTWDWATLWWQHYAIDHGCEPAVIVARRQSKVVAIAPLFVRTERDARLFRVRVLRFIGSGADTSPDYLNVICAPGEREAAEAAIVDHLFSELRWHKLALSDVRRPSSLSRSLDLASANRRGHWLPLKTRKISRANLPGSWEAYRRSLSRKRRKQINHRQNRLNAAGDVELSLCANLQEIEEATQALIELHRLRWLSKGEQGGFSSKAYVEFHRAVIKQFFKTDALWLATLKLDGRIIGVQYIFIWRGELLYFQSGYSPEHESLSPGHVLFTYTIERAIEQGIVGIDMLKGDYAYKNAYARHSIETCDYHYARPGLTASVQRSKQCLKRLLR